MTAEGRGSTDSDDSHDEVINSLSQPPGLHLIPFLFPAPTVFLRTLLAHGKDLLNDYNGMR